MVIAFILIILVVTLKLFIERHKTIPFSLVDIVIILIIAAFWWWGLSVGLFGYEPPLIKKWG